MNIQGHDAPKFDPGFLDIQFCYPGSGTPSYFCASFSFLSWCSTKTRMFKVPFECSAKPACFVRQFWVCCVWIQLICSSRRQTCVCFCKKLFDWFWSEKKPEQPLRFDQMWWTELWKTKDLSPNSQREVSWWFTHAWMREPENLLLERGPFQQEHTCSTSNRFIDMTGQMVVATWIPFITQCISRAEAALPSPAARLETTSTSARSTNRPDPGLTG